MLAGMNTEWREMAACRDIGTGWWLADARTVGGRIAVSEAQAVCHVCPVRGECAGEALDYLGRDLSGIWAGINVRSRSARTQLRRLVAGAGR
jgi:hypothetical protein